MDSNEVARKMAEEKERQEKKQRELEKEIGKKQLHPSQWKDEWKEDQEPRYERTAASMRNAFQGKDDEGFFDKIRKTLGVGK